jgi:hypothetical protein
MPVKTNMKKETLFSRAMLRELREQFGRIERVDVDSLLFKNFRSYVKRLPEPRRAQLAANTIPWLSIIARHV